MPNNSLGKYTAALSIKIHVLRGIFFEFSDGIMAAVFLPLTLKLKETMNTISLTPTKRVAPDVGLANALARKALEFLTSQSLSIVLGVVAFIAIMSYHITGAHPVRMACITLAWAVQLALYLTLDIKKGGAEL